MSLLSPRIWRRSAVMAGLLLSVAGCAPAPIYKLTANSTPALPSAVIQAPEQYRERDVVWAGRIVVVTNLRDHSEIDIVAYPSDDSQRPRLNRNGDSRFIAVFPSYIEPLDYPQGTPITISGKVVGTRTSAVGQANLVLPLVSVAQSHRWTPQEMDSGHPHFQFGVGAGIGIH